MMRRPEPRRRAMARPMPPEPIIARSRWDIVCSFCVSSKIFPVQKIVVVVIYLTAMHGGVRDGGVVVVRLFWEMVHVIVRSWDNRWSNGQKVLSVN